MFPLVLSASRRLRQTAIENRHLALHDSLTGLANRNLLRDRLELAIQSSSRTGEAVGLLLIDLDRFKDVNDTLGHDKGDELLEVVADRLKRSVRGSDTVARLGGDEFAIVVDGMTSDATLPELAKRVTEALAHPFVIHGLEVEIRASIGGSVYPTHADCPEELLRHADIAMYVAKASGESYAAYTPDVDAHSESQLALTGELRRAIESDDQLVVYYQPIASSSTGVVASVEALVRWQHPTRGMVSPVDFIPVAERSGLIQGLTAKVLDTALAQQHAWANDGLDLSVSVNLSAHDLRSMGVVTLIEGLLVRNDVPPSRLELEVTETAVLANPDAAVRVVDGIRALGARVALDDFGTGYSSLTFLKRLKPDRVKIDRSFIEAMADDRTDRTIVESVITLAHSLAIGVTAEGVETSEQWEILRALSCDLVQGYYLARPHPAREVTPWLHARRMRAARSSR
jgi:diguanylate cyclase